MSRVVPVGYLTLRETVGQVESAMFAGVPDRPAVVKLREQEGEADDGEASQLAATELWKAVDQDAVGLVAIGGDPRVVVRLPAAMTREIPLLRRVAGFAFLRPSNRHYAELSAWFRVGQLPNVTLASHDRDVRILCRDLRRRVRYGAASSRKAGKVGRPALRPGVQSCIKDLVSAPEWQPTLPIKVLTGLVSLRLGHPISDDTVGRALHDLYLMTRDRRFLRPRRRRSAQTGQ